MERLVDILLTYLLHSTLLLGAALVVRVALRARRLALQEALLRAALVGGVATTALQVGLDLRPLAGAWELPARPALATASLETPQRRSHEVPLERTRVPPVRAPQTHAVAPRPLAIRMSRAPWHAWFAAAWAGLAGLALARLGTAALRLRRLLRARRPLDTSPLDAHLDALAVALGLRAPLRVSVVARLGAPLATGLARPEVCLPPRVFEQLALDEQAALCAHELAHVARRDPAWLCVARLVEALAPLQPLNVWARRRLQDIAECLSDDLAVRASRQPLGLARSLVDVASWTHPEFTPATAAGAQGARSRLGHRVERLMDPVRKLERPVRAALPLASAAVLAAALVLPVVSHGATAAPRRPAPPAPAAPTAPVAPPAAVAPTPRVAPVAPVAAVPPPPPTAPTAAEAEGDTADTQRRLDELGRRIEERAGRHAEAAVRLEAEMDALREQLRPREHDLERLSAALEDAARELAAQAQDEPDAPRTGEARERLERTREQVRAAAEALRLPHEELRALAAKAREMAEAAQPTPEELAELQHLARTMARTARPDARHIEGLTREAMREAREELRRAAREMQRAAEELKRAQEELRRSQDERRAPRP